MYEKQRHVVQSSNNSHISPDSNYELSETTLVRTFPTRTFISIVWDNPGSDRSIMCYHNKFSLGHSSNTNYLFACIVWGENLVQTVHQTQLSILCNLLLVWFLLNVYFCVCDSVHFRTWAMLARKFTKYRFMHFPSFFSAHVDTSPLS